MAFFLDIKIIMDKDIKNILITIENNGYEAFLVGGYVRDYLLMKCSTDVDIATNMPYDKLKSLFKYTKKFDEYNSIKFNIKEYNISITTYRYEFSYQNNKPTKIELCNNISEDARRRDFTINAIYMNKDNDIYDPFNGLSDLNNKIIKAIRSTSKRLIEDNTRILRAIRLMIILDFHLDNELNNFIINNKSLLNNINYGKKKYELDKIFSSNNYMNFFNYIVKYNLCECFGISFNKVDDCGNYLEVWSKLKYSEKYNFTKNEKKIINSYLKK